MEQTAIFNKIPLDYTDQYNLYFDLEGLKAKYREKKKGFHVRYAREHPVSFAYFMLGKKLRPYQAYAIDKILENPKTALCWARRLGKSTVFGILAFWMTYFNKYPKNNIEAFTVVGIISKEHDASKKILAAIKGLVYDGDLRWYQVTKNKPYEEKNYFSKRLTVPMSSSGSNNS